VPRSETAKAVTKEVIYAQVPLAYRLNPERYLRVAGMIPLRETAETQGKYRRRLEEMLLEPRQFVAAAMRLEGKTDLTQDQEEAVIHQTIVAAGLRLESLGRDSVPILEKGLKSD